VKIVTRFSTGVFPVNKRASKNCKINDGFWKAKLYDEKTEETKN
jgi:hypothetical protein